MKKLILLSVIFLWPVLSGFHKFYLSHYQIKKNDGNLQVTIKIFTDDLELALQKAGFYPVRLNAGKDEKLADHAVERYLKEHFGIQADGKTLEAQWIGKEYEADVTWVYLEYPTEKKPSQLKINCRSLTEVYEDQGNLISLEGWSKKQSTLLTRGTSVWEVAPE